MILILMRQGLLPSRRGLFHHVEVQGSVLSKSKPTRLEHWFDLPNREISLLNPKGGMDIGTSPHYTLLALAEQYEALTCRSAGARGTWGNCLAIDIALLPELAGEKNRSIRSRQLG
jgi:hypothetical protein